MKEGKGKNKIDYSILRRPNLKEKDVYIKALDFYFNRTNSFSKKVRLFFCIMTIFWTLSILSSFGNIKLEYIFFGIISLYITYRSNKTVILHNDTITMYRSGNFYVLDGNVKRISQRSGKPGIMSICFKNEEVNYESGWHRCRYEGLNMDTILHLVVIPNESKKWDYEFIFTDFMLTDEGIKLHW